MGILTGSPSQVAGVALAEALPALLAGPVAGVLADRWAPRRSMAAGDGARALFVLALLLIPHSLLVPGVYAVGFGMALIELLFRPAKQVAIRSLIAREQIARAQALARTTESAALVLGPALGAGLLVLAGPPAGLLFDALSFGVGAAAVLLARVPALPKAGGEGVGKAPLRRLVGEFAAGVRLVRADGDLLTALLANGVVAVVGYLWFAVDVFFVQQALGAPKGSVGVLWAVSGVGGVLGGLAATVLAPRLPPRRLLPIGIGIHGLALVWYALTTSFAVAVPAAFAAGLGGSLIAEALGSVLMERTPPALLGRVTALVEGSGQGAAVVAILALVALQGALSPAQTLLLCGLALCATCFAVALRFARPA